MNNPNDDDSNKKGSTDNVGSSSHKNLLDKTMQVQLNERRDEQLLFERFKSVAANRMNQLSRQVEDGGGQKSLTMGDEEKRIIANMNGRGLREGVAAGLATFLVLRRGPVYVGRWVRRRQLAGRSTLHSTPGSGYQLSDPRTPTGATGSNPFQRSTSPEFPRSRSLVLRATWFMFDVTLSLMMAASVSMAYTDTDEIRRQILDMPLVSGRSLTADALCDDVVRELVMVQEEKNAAYERLQKLNKRGTRTPASSLLEGIVQFCENCQRRRYVEKVIRQERGMGSTEPVEVPIPGVDRNGPRLVVNNLGQEMVVRDGGDEGDFQEQFGRHDMDWANDVVSEREDQDRNR